MLTPRSTLARRVVVALDASPSRIPVLIGGCGSGRTTLLQQLRDRVGRAPTHAIDVERVATTPERFLRAIAATSPVPFGDGSSTQGARAAFDATLDFFTRARTSGGDPITFLLDEFLELRTFESFPGLRSVLRDLVGALGSSGNRFVLTSRYVARAHRLLRDAPAQFEIVHVAPLTPAEIRATLPPTPAPRSTPGSLDDEDDRGRDDLARLVHAISDGRPSYARLITEASASMAPRSGAMLDPVSALSSVLAPGGSISTACRFCYELRLHRARGYGALKAILDVLSEEEPLTLTEIALRLRRTPGSTKDYLSWLEDVDLIVSRQKRYSFSDPMLRLWVRLHCHAVPPSDEDVAREVHAYVVARLPQAEPALALAGAPQTDAARDKSWGIIEID